MADPIPIFTVTDYPCTHIPLALGTIRAYAQGCRGSIVDERFRFMHALRTPSAPTIKIGRSFGPGVWLFSNYMWSVDRSLEISRAIKAHDPRNITIHGGPSTPKYPQACESFLRDHPHVDIAVRGEGEVTTADLLAAIGRNWTDVNARYEELTQIEGITFSPHPDNSAETIRTADRPRSEDLDQIPSPYLRGNFDPYGHEMVAAILETNRGCPYRCTFCDWGSLIQSKIKLFDLRRIRAEVEWIAKRAIPVLWIADANFGIFDRDVKIASFIAVARKRYGHPKEVVVNYAKNATKRLAEIVKIFGKASITTQGVISIQTADRETLKVIRRSNIKTEHYTELANVFHEEGLPLATDLMLGLPGATVRSFKRDLQRYFDANITVKAYSTKLLPNSPMADPDYLREHKIEVDRNDFLVSTFSYTRQDMRERTSLYRLYDLCENFDFLRYVLRFLQWDYGHLPIAVLHSLLKCIVQSPERFMTIDLKAKPDRTLPLVLRCDANSWGAFYEEIKAFASSALDVKEDASFETVLRVNQDLMPQPGYSYPRRLELAHDFVSYFRDHSEGGVHSKPPLSSYLPEILTISDPDDLCQIASRKSRQYNSHQVFWELESPLRRHQSAPYFLEST